MHGSYSPTTLSGDFPRLYIADFAQHSDCSTVGQILTHGGALLDIYKVLVCTCVLTIEYM